VPWKRLLLFFLCALAVLAFFLLLNRRTFPAVGYQGPLPSIEARQELERLFGRTLPAGSVAFSPNELVVRSFLVTPQAPTVIVEDPSLASGAQDALPSGQPGRYWIPVLTDGDLADLFQRAGLEPSAWMQSETSDEYERFVAGR